MMGGFHAQVGAAVTVACPPDRLWRVLSDLNRYQQWNPFIYRAQGRLETGARLKLRLAIPRGPRLRVRVRLLDVTPPERIVWMGRLVLPGLFDGAHRFELQPRSADRTELIQSERFSGLLVPLLGRYIGAGARRGFEAMNAALRQKLENG